MKLGAENRATTIVAIALMALAVFLLVRMFSGGTQPAAAAPSASQPGVGPAPAPATVRGRRGGRGTRPPTRNAPVAINSLDPRLRLDLLKQSEQTDYKGTGRNIFRAQAEIPRPVESPIRKAATTPPVPQPQPGPPSPPPINLKFFGFANQEGEPKKVLLAQGDNIFVAAEGEIVNRRYKITKINANSVEIEDVLSNNRQTIPLTAG